MDAGVKQDPGCVSHGADVLSIPKGQLVALTKHLPGYTAWQQSASCFFQLYLPLRGK